MSRWYAVPAYKGARGIDGQHHVVNAHGELVCTCERLQDAESIAADHNRSTPARREPSHSLTPSPGGRASIQSGGTG
jgi:hypothetical protein